MNFSEALIHLRLGAPMRRKGWKYDAKYIFINKDENRFYEKISNAAFEKDVVHWLLPEDVFADDWEIVK